MQYHHQSRRTPCHPAGEARKPHLRVDFDRRLKLEFHGSKVTSDAGFLAYRELDGALGLTEVAGGHFQDSRLARTSRWRRRTGQPKRRAEPRAGARPADGGAVGLSGQGAGPK